MVQAWEEAESVEEAWQLYKGFVRLAPGAQIHAASMSRLGQEEICPYPKETYSLLLTCAWIGGIQCRLLRLTAPAITNVYKTHALFFAM